MAKTSTSFKPGRSGNPAGRPKGPTAREALRRALNAPDGDGKTRLDQWAEEMASATDLEFRLNVLRFLEGSQPQQESDAVSLVDVARLMAAKLGGGGGGVAGDGAPPVP